MISTVVMNEKLTNATGHGQRCTVLDCFVIVLTVAPSCASTRPLTPTWHPAATFAFQLIVTLLLMAFDRQGRPNLSATALNDRARCTVAIRQPCLASAERTMELNFAGRCQVDR